MFLAALFIIGTSLAILQSVANPFVTIIGPHESAAKRISIMGICNKFAGIISPLLVAAAVIRPEDKQIMAAVEQGLLTGTAKEQALDQMIQGVIAPYLILAAFLFVFGFIFFKSGILRLPACISLALSCMFKEFQALTTQKIKYLESRPEGL